MKQQRWKEIKVYCRPGREVLASRSEENPGQRPRSLRVQHFIGVLHAVSHRGGRIGVLRICGRVVPVGGHFDARTPRQQQRFLQIVHYLPMEIVVRYA